jgi:hypothetical protein
MARMTVSIPRPAVRPPSDADDAPPCCGWFDSSHDLHRGLKVTEHDVPAAVAALVPLSWWLHWELEAAASSVGARCSLSPASRH